MYRIYRRLSDKFIRIFLIKGNGKIALQDIANRDSSIHPRKTLYPQKITAINSKCFYDEDFYNQRVKKLSQRRDARHEYVSSEIYTLQLKNVLVNREDVTLFDATAGSFITDSSYWTDRFAFPGLLELLRIKKLASTGLYLYNANNYYHWFHETLARLVVIKKNLPKAPVYLSEQFTPWQKQILQLFDLEQLDYRTIDAKHSIFKSKELTFLAISYCPEIIHKDLLGEMNRHLKNTMNHRKEASNRIYISRKKARHRKVVNEEELEKCLVDKYGFKVFCLEDFNVQQQYTIVGRASLVVAVHGPSLTNLIASDRPIVIELLNQEHLVECYAMLAAGLECTYMALACENSGKPSGIVHGKEFYGYNDIRVDIPRLETALKRLDKDLY